ncbi:MAG: VTT domain-containing protein [Deltaproteobacteria bacterium]|nr:VTT domain-containing protein [Deltaproteobacteria bacterium]
MEHGNILKEGRNCQRIEKTDRLSFLVDADAYYKAFVDAVDQAQHAVYISGWDIDSRVRLIRSSKDDSGQDISLGHYLNQKAVATPGLNIYILCWDFSVIYALEREWLSSLKFEWNRHHRIHFFLDDEHPAGASHHQKFVVVDDMLAFSGGIDLTKNRWDTPAHDPEDPRRIDPNGKAYSTFHDVQTVADAHLANDLGDLFRERWFYATGVQLDPVERKTKPHWPLEASPHLTNVQAAIARTYPSYKGRQEVREVEALFLDIIQSAQNYLYIENQYFTSSVISDALIESLKMPQGPDILLVLPEQSRGLLEKSTMEALRAREIKRILEADFHKRLWVVYPALSKKEDVFVHAKVMIADDRLVRVGSANLTNRSMGLDTECDVVAEALDDVRNRDAIAAFRNRLIAEHTGHKTEEVSRAFSSEDSFLNAVRSLSHNERSFKKISINNQLPVDGAKLVPDTSLLDPNRPVELDRIFDHFVEKPDENSKGRPLLRILIILGALLALAGAWRWTPLHQWMTPQKIAHMAETFKESAFTPVFVMAAYLVGGLAMVPVTVLIGATAMVFPAATAVVYAFSGSILSAILSYGIGARLGSAPLHKIAGPKIEALNKRLARNGILAVAVIRNLPLAPYTMVNMAAGASKVKFRDYVLGTGIGMAPGILAITVFADRLLQAIKDPNWLNISVSGALLSAFGVGFWWVRRRLRRREKGE